MKDFYTYPAIFYFDNNGISIEFPDLPGCIPCAENMKSALKNAGEALALHLYGMVKDKDEIPEPTDIRDIHIAGNGKVVLIEVNMAVLREKL